MKVRICTVLILAAVSGDASAYVPEARRVVVEAALKSAVPPELALAVAHVGMPGKAVGVMQVREALAREELGVGSDVLYRRRANAGIGVALLERLHRRHGGRWDLALSHYRGGPPDRCEEGSVVGERTLDYVAEVLEWWRHYQKDGSVARLAEEAPEGARPRERAMRVSVRPGDEPGPRFR